MSTDVTRERINRVLAGVLEPLARTLLRCGVSYTEFAELSKRAFVDVASKDYGVRNRPTNIARVAVMTGLSRREVSRFRRNGKGGRRQIAAREITLPAAVLEEWHSNRRYQDGAGIPRMLPFAGRGLSFSKLVSGVTRDIPPGAMRRELFRAGAIRVVDRRYLIPLKRYFIPDSANERLMVGLELGLRRLAETIAHNSDPDQFAGPRFQRFVEGPRLSRSELVLARKHVQEVLSGMTIELDRLMSSFVRRDSKKSAKKRPTATIGVGVYYHDDCEL